MGKFDRTLDMQRDTNADFPLPCKPCSTNKVDLEGCEDESNGGANTVAASANVTKASSISSLDFVET